MSIEKLTGVPVDIPFEVRVSGTERLMDALRAMFLAMDLESIEYDEFPLAAFRTYGRINEPGLWKMTVKMERVEG